MSSTAVWIRMVIFWDTGQGVVEEWKQYLTTASRHTREDSHTTTTERRVVKSTWEGGGGRVLLAQQKDAHARIKRRRGDTWVGSG